MPTVGLIASAIGATGNATTIQRISSSLVSQGFETILADLNKDHEICQLRAEIKKGKVDTLIGLHAFRAGSLLITMGVPYAIILGGTDMNETAPDDVSTLSVMKSCLRSAQVVVAFNEALYKAAHDLNPELVLSPVSSLLACHVLLPAPSLAASVNTEPPHEDNVQSSLCSFSQPSNSPTRSLNSKIPVCIIPQAIDLRRCEELAAEAIASSFNLHAMLGVPQSHTIFLLVSAVRAVKDPLLLKEVMEGWYSRDATVHLVLVGPVLEESLGTRVKSASAQPSDPDYRGFYYAGSLPPCLLIGALSQASACVNTSLSEGQPASLLEAMATRTLVFARDIPGNASVVQHGRTGLLFRDPEHFLTLAEAFVNACRESVSSNHRINCRRSNGSNSFNSSHNDLNPSRPAETKALLGLGLGLSSSFSTSLPARTQNIPGDGSGDSVEAETTPWCAASYAAMVCACVWMYVYLSICYVKEIDIQRECACERDRERDGGRRIEKARKSENAKGRYLKESESEIEMERGIER
jgi:hypothetical protein